jgi:acyl-CoA thioesterase I
MKTLLFSILLGPALTIILIQYPGRPESRSLEFFRRLEASTPQVIVLYGTSLTVTGAWAEALKDWFQTEYPDTVTVINSGGSGQNSTWGAQNLVEKVISHGPGLVLIEFSYNDAHAKFNLQVQDAWNNLNAIVAGIQKERPGAAIVLQTMNVGWDAPNGNRSLSARPRLEAFNEVYRGYAREHGLPLLDHYGAWSRLKREDPERFRKYVPDGSHPTKEGSLAITWPTIRSFLVKSQQEARAAK